MPNCEKNKTEAMIQTGNTAYNGLHLSSPHSCQLEAHVKEAHVREAHVREAHVREAHVREAHVREAHVYRVKRT